MTPLIVCAVILAGLLLLDLISGAIAGFGVTASLWRHLSGKRKGTRFVSVPDDLQTAIANDLIQEGSELVVGFNNEWDGANVRRFAISPQQAKAEPGEIFQIAKMTRRRLELKRVRGSDIPL